MELILDMEICAGNSLSDEINKGIISLVKESFSIPIMLNDVPVRLLCEERALLNKTILSEQEILPFEFPNNDNLSHNFSKSVVV